MGTKPTTTERERFDALVDCVLTAPKPAKNEPLTDEQKSRLLRYLREDIEAEEARKSQVIPIKTA